MISIRVSDEGLRRSRRLVDKFVVHGTLQIAKHMLCSLPMNWTRVEVEFGKNSGSISDVWPCGDCKIRQGPKNWDVRVLLHLLSFCIILRAHGSGKTSPRVERSGN